MRRAVTLSVLLALAVLGLAALANGMQPVAAAPTTLWTEVAEARIAATGTRQIVPASYRSLSLDLAALRAQLANAPLERSGAAGLEFALPTPDGGEARFAIYEYSMMEPGLAARYPDFKTYLGQGLDDPTASVRLDVTVQGFHAMVLGGTAGTWYVDPYQTGDTQNYIVYYKKDYGNPRSPDAYNDQVVMDEVGQQIANSEPDFVPTDGILRTYRLANAATGEYTAFHGGTVAAGQAAIVTSVNRVNGVYEREVAVRMVLIANNDVLVYTNAATDPYTNDDGVAMLAQNQSNLDTVIGNANYDFGHVYSTGGGGVAGLGVICRTGQKARGVTGLPAPTGDAFYIDYVAHEMGHQFGGAHTFNSTTGSCGGGNRSATSAYEPGSGTTIMAYAGICSTENTQNNSNDVFHTRSFDQIRTYILGANGGSCDVETNGGNDAPVVDAGPSYNIPASTPFELSGVATDTSQSTVTYLWEQFDRGAATSGGTVNNDLGTNPLFRTFVPLPNGERIFPSLQYILAGQNDVPNSITCPAVPGVPGSGTGTCAPGEAPATTNRTLNFRLTARDNVANGGGVNYDTTQLTVTAAIGPFEVTSQNSATTWAGLSSQTVTWNVGGTTGAPVSCANVDILVSTDLGDSFAPVREATPNDGTDSITVPNTATTEGRVKVKCSNNVFFDINNANITINAIPTAVSLSDLTTTPSPITPLALLAAGLVALGLVVALRRK